MNTYFYLLILFLWFISCIEYNGKNDLGHIGVVLFDHIVIDSGASSPAKPYGKAVGDLNSDGQPDLFVSSAHNGGMHWYRYPSWDKMTIRSEGSWSEDCQIFDVDGDGDNDVVNGNAVGLYWYENTINSSAGNKEENWPEHLIGSDGTNIHDLEVADVNGDGRPDVVIRYEKEFQRPVTIYTQQGLSKWEEHVNTNHSFRKGEGLALGDIDLDGDADIVIGHIWLENVDHGVDWIEHRYAREMPEQVMIRVGDLRRNGRNEIIVTPQSAQQGNLSWYSVGENPFSLWTEHIIQENVSRMHGLTIADFNLDGLLDLHTSIRHDHPGPSDPVSIWISDGASSLQFNEQVLDLDGSHFSKTFDIDQDGDVDIFGANWSGPDGLHVDIDLWINRIR